MSDTIADQRPTLATWLEPPGNRWAFRHVRELIPTARVAARSARSLERAPVDGLLTEALVDYLTRSFSDALVVLHDGRVVVEWYAPGVTAEDRHIVFSVTKSVTALVAGALVGRGVLDPDTEVATYVPESAGGGYGNARVRDLLDMTASVQFVEDYDGPDMRRYREVNGTLPPIDDTGTHAFLAGMRPAGSARRRTPTRSPG